MKNNLYRLTLPALLLATAGLTGCNSTPEKNISAVATACEKGLNKLSQQVQLPSEAVSQVNISRANSLLLAARVQHQFAEYDGCLDKLQRAEDYLSGENTAIISKLSFNTEL